MSTPAAMDGKATAASPEPSGGRGCMTVYYDGSCPLCSAEVGVYKRARAAEPGLALVFTDVSRADATHAPDLPRDRAMARFHVRRPDGSLASGAEAFLALWGGLEGWRHLARVQRIPGATRVLETLYRAFLVFRPAMTGAARRMGRWRASTKSS